jgi:tetratricopeptide (TPR) repeat protein
VRGFAAPAGADSSGTPKTVAIPRCLFFLWNSGLVLATTGALSTDMSLQHLKRRQRRYLHFAAIFMMLSFAMRTAASTDSRHPGNTGLFAAGLARVSVIGWAGARPEPTSSPLTVRLEEKQKRGFEEVTSYAATVRSVVVDILVVLLVGHFLFVLFRELRRDSVVIDPISTPQDLADKGYTPDVVAKRIASEISRLQEVARYRTGLEDAVQLSTAQIDFTLPTAGISFRNVVRYFRESFRRPEQRLQGDLTRDGDGTICIVLRTGDHRTTSATLRVSGENEIPDLLTRAAFEAASLVDPYLIAGYWLRIEEERDQTFERTFEAVQVCLRRKPVEKHHRAYSIWGIALMLQRRYQLAEEKYRTGIKLAWRHRPRFRKIIGSFPSGAALYNNWGIALRSQRRYCEAIAMYRRAIRCDRRYVYAQGNLGTVFNDQRKYRAARHAFEKAIHIDPLYASAWNGLGFALWKSGDLKGPVSKFMRAIDIDPNFGWSYLNWARLLLARNRHDDAIEQLRRAADRKLLPAQVYTVWGDVLVRASEFEEAEKMYERAVSADSTTASGFDGLAHLRESQQRYREGIKADRIAIRGDRYYFWSLFRIALMLRQAGHYPVAVKIYRRLIELDPWQPSFHVGWAELLRAMHQPLSAIERAKQAIKIDPLEPWAWRSWGWALIDMHHYDEAIEKFRIAAERNPSEADNQVGWGEALARLARLEEAQRYFEHGAELDGNNGWTWTAQVKTLLELNRKSEAYDVLELAVKNWSRSPSVLLACASLYRSQFQDNKRSAELGAEALKRNSFLSNARVEVALGLKPGDKLRLEQLSQAVAAAPWNDLPWRVLADDVFQSGDHEKAFDYFARAHRRLPQNIPILVAWSDRLRDHAGKSRDDDTKTKIYAQAEETIRTAVKIDPWSTAALQRWGNLLLDRKLRAEALVKFNDALELDRWDPYSWLGKARTLADLKRAKEAKAACLRIREMRPGNEDWEKRVSAVEKKIGLIQNGGR